MSKKKSSIYSHSRLSTFEQCPFRYKLRYIDKIKPLIEKTIEAHLGSAVHDTLEWIYNQVKEKKLPTIDEVINYYAVKWQDSYSKDTLIVKKQLTQKDYFNKGVQFLVDYYTKHQPFEDGTISTEERIVIELDENSEYKVQGFIDRLAYNSEKQEYEVHDYKTANSLPSKEKVETDRQLALYSIAIKEKYGFDKNVCLIWHYLAHNQKICSTRTNEQLENLKNEIIELIKQIEATSIFPTSKSILCGWCEYKTMCPEFGCKPPTKEKQTGLNIFGGVNNVIDNVKEKEKDEDKLDIW